MNRKYSPSDICHKAIYCLGLVTVFALAFVLVFTAYIKIDSMISHQHINHGVVTKKCYEDGHYWYSSYVFGEYSITKRNGGEAYFYIAVTDGDKQDFWKVSEEEWDALSIGDCVHR